MKHSLLAQHAVLQAAALASPATVCSSPLHVAPFVSLKGGHTARGGSGGGTIDSILNRHA
jgi:hypothetical protein